MTDRDNIPTKKAAAPPPPSARTVTPDPDYLADMETAEGQAAIRKRMKQRERGQAISRPKGME